MEHVVTDEYGYGLLHSIGFSALARDCWDCLPGVRVQSNCGRGAQALAAALVCSADTTAVVVSGLAA